MENRILIVRRSIIRTGNPTHPTNIGAVILAAGPSTRMGTPKQLLQFRGETLVRRAASAAIQAGCRPVVVVTGAHSMATREELRELDVQETENKKWESGMSSSLRVGMQTLVTTAPRVSAVVLMLCDQPFVTPEIVAGLIAAHGETGRTIVASGYGGSYGVPALFSRKYFAELTALEGALGAKQVIQKHLAKAHLISFPKGEIDIDTQDDFARLN
jgi:molybdenum cofactor cytidylyltransferase